MKKFHLTSNYALINFDAIMENSQIDIINSNGFELVLKAFIKSLYEQDHDLISVLKDINSDDILNLYKQLLINDVKDAFSNVSNLKFENRLSLYTFTEALYDYWRELIRFGLLKGTRSYDPQLKVNNLIETNNRFNEIVITLYRTISQKLLMDDFHVYRQLPAGVNASMLYVNHRFTTNDNYLKIQNVPFVTKIVTSPPFIINSKSNTRTGLFTKIDYNPLKDLNLETNHFIAFPIKVGPLLAFVYIHRNYVHQGIALSNLFEFASFKEFQNNKPDLVFVYGILEEQYDCKYYYDQDEDMFVGFVSQNDKNDYFGYLKKMLLTLHNVKMITKKHLPIHGAMVKIKLNNNEIKYVAIVGDSGAGKSETLEALRIISGNKIKNMQVIFDDMGTFKLKDKIYANGTETGAFVRLDDLDAGYAYQIMDRVMFLNPNKVNARVVLPISSYKFITEDHPIDMLLYANNYSEENSGIKEFKQLEEALNVFKKGVRKAKGTTSEVGLVESFFANPFGPVQMKEEVSVLLDLYFNKLKEDKVFIGEIYTKLAVSGMESSGPKEAAQILLDYLIKN